mgnify:FL=1|jgi:leader peptidase (prepilin peptidase)/N-methyltransferase
MESIYLIFFFLLGLAMGSFLCVVGLRLGKEEDFIKGRSYCDNCHHELKALDLVPIFSYLFLRGRCRYCKKKISPLSFFLELFTGLLYMIAFYSFGFSLKLILVLLAISLTMIIFASDLTYLIIPDEVLIFFGISFFIIEVLQKGLIGGISCLANALTLFLIMYAIMLAGNFLFKKESLGGGDIKLLFVIGLVLEPLLGVINIFLASLIALPISLLLYRKNKEHVIPFGPFILVAFLIILFSKVTTTDVINFFYTLAG